jgi:DNA polymerase-3 subunit delta'
MSFDDLPEQHEAKRLLGAALAEGAAHAYLLHGPPGTGKRRAALAFAGAILGDAARVEHGTHPDLYLLEPLGEMIRIDEIRALRHDLHMRPFEADRRVYVIVSAHLLNEDAADALLKDLEEPPPYAVIVLVADELGPLPPTIRSRCQLVPFRRLSERAVREFLAERAPGLDETRRIALARVAAGRLDRAERLLDPEAASRRDELLRVARSVYADDAFDPADAAGAAARERTEAELEGLELTARDADQRLRRAQRGAEREELLASLEELASWYRDLVVAAAGAESALVHADRLDALREDASRERAADAETAAEVVRETWRALEEFNLAPSLALEALFVRLHRAFAGGILVSTDK